MGFYTMLMLVFVAGGLLEGALFGLTLLEKRWYVTSVLGGIFSALSAWYISWYTLGYYGASEMNQTLSVAACGWVAGLLLALLPLAAGWLIHLAPAGREFAKAFSFLAALLSLGIGIYGSYTGPVYEDVTHFTVPAEDLPAAFQGYRIAQITDTHIGPYYHVSDLAQDLDRAKEEGADMVALTGDLIDDTRFLNDACRVLTEKAASFPGGIWYVWGNHEYFRGKENIREAIIKTPLILLENGNRPLTQGGASIYVAGTDYPWGDRDKLSSLEKTMADRAFAGIPKEKAVLFLAHHPDFIAEGFKRRAFLTLTGHTHGTQFGIMGEPLITPFSYTRGRYTDGKSVGYVSRGNGGWFPFRLGCSRELAIFTLKRV